MWAAVLASVVCVVLCVLVHLAALRALWRVAQRWPGHATRGVGVAALVVGLLAAHLAEVGVFAVGLVLTAALDGDEREALGWYRDGGLGVWYYSAAFYTTLGAERPPTAGLRAFAAVEALTGLILVTWTASFLFLVMQRTWGPGATGGARDG